MLLNFLSFYDKKREGLNAYWLGIEEGINPYFVCYFEDIDYRKWNYDLDKLENEIWYEKYTSKLHKVKEILLHKEKWVIYEATDVEAYLEIWAMASNDLGIAFFTISGYEKVDNIVKMLNRYDSKTETLSMLETWGYCQVYGGGSDEHYALFYSSNPLLLDKVEKQLKKEGIII